MPNVQPRRQWARDMRVDQEVVRGLAVPLARCQECMVLVGRDYDQQEVYLLPELAKRKVLWRPLCAECALEEPYSLSFGYCLVSNADWQAAPEALLVLPRQARALKERLLSEALVPAWNQHFLRIKTHYLQHRRPLTARLRAAHFARFRSRFEPEVATIVALLDRLQGEAQ